MDESEYTVRGIEPVAGRFYKGLTYCFRYKGYLMPKYYIDQLDRVDNFHTPSSDVWVSSFPKSGTTWTQELVYMINSGLDYEAAKEKLDDRCPFFEFRYPGLDVIEANQKSPRYFKTHLPLSLFPREANITKPKIFYVARNPKDVVLSYYLFVHKYLKADFVGEGTYTGDFLDYCQMFVDDEVPYGPWWKHVREAWDRRHEDNIFFLTYEELQSDVRGTIGRMADFLGKSLSTEQVEAVAKHCSFKSMQSNQATNYHWFKTNDSDMAVQDDDQHFLRKGIVGDWCNHMTPEMAAKMDEIVKTRLEPAGLTLLDSLHNLPVVK